MTERQADQKWVEDTRAEYIGRSNGQQFGGYFHGVPIYWNSTIGDEKPWRALNALVQSDGDILGVSTEHV